MMDTDKYPYRHTDKPPVRPNSYVPTTDIQTPHVLSTHHGTFMGNYRIPPTPLYFKNEGSSAHAFTPAML